MILLAAFVHNVQAANLLSSGGHELAIPSGLPVARPHSEVVPPVEAPPADDPEVEVPASPAPAAAVALPLAVTFPVADEEAADVEEPVPAEAAPAPEPPAPPRSAPAEPSPEPPPVPPEEGLGEYLGSFKVTCYALRGITFSGEPVALDGVAVDPAVIPIGASLYIDGLGWKVARDTGRLIIDKTIDIWNPSRDWCIQWGVQYHDVWAAPE